MFIRKKKNPHINESAWFKPTLLKGQLCKTQLFEDNKGNSVGMMKNENEILRLEK